MISSYFTRLRNVGSGIVWKLIAMSIVFSSRVYDILNCLAMMTKMVPFVIPASIGSIVRVPSESPIARPSIAKAMMTPKVLRVNSPSLYNWYV